MSSTRVKELLDAGVHFGHLKRKWDPQMAPYIFMEKNGIHIIDLNKTAAKLEETCTILKQVAKSGKKVLIVGTKKQAKEIVAEKARNVNMPYVSERWPGGMLTNFVTIRKSIKKMTALGNLLKDNNAETTISKKERLVISRTRAKLEKDFGSIAELNRLPAALFIVDIKREHIAVAEAKRLNIPTFGIVDTNSNPNEVDYPIPANDDAADSVALILDIITAAIGEGLQERKEEKAAEAAREQKVKEAEAAKEEAKKQAEAKKKAEKVEEKETTGK